MGFDCASRVCEPFELACLKRRSRSDPSSSVSSPYHDRVLRYAWSRLDIDEGLGLVRLVAGDPIRVEGHEVAVDSGEAWAVTFQVELDRGWRTRVAQVAVVDDASERKLLLEADGEGNWLRDGVPSPELQGCLDVDIAATPFTNTFVIRRLGLSVGETAEIRAAWVGVPDLDVGALEQIYVRLQPRDGLDRYEYRANGSANGWIIEVDQDGVAMDYEGFARRIHP